MSDEQLAFELAVASLQGLQAARIVSFAFFALTIYEWMITLDQEVEYFWTGKWTASRALFFANRYFPIVIMILAFLAFETKNPSDGVCLRTTQVTFFLNILAIGIVQAMLVLRVWYLFSANKYVQWGTAFAFAISLGLSLGFTVTATVQLQVIPDPLYKQHGGPGCRIERPPTFWKIYLPSLVLHTLLYILTAIRAMRNRQLLKHATVAKRLLRDGGLFLFVVFVSVGISAIGSFLTDFPQINIVVFFSNYLLATTSIAVSRVMFSIHSLAAHLGSDTGFLLSNVELSRVGWRKGAKEGEILVERWLDDDESINYDVEGTNSQLQESRIGVYDNMPWGHNRRYSDD